MKIINLILFLLITVQINAQDILSLKERARVIEEIQKDVIGPLMGEEEEWLEWEKPQTRYFSGVLYPKKTPFKADDQLKNTNADGGDDNDDKWYLGAYAGGPFKLLNYASGSWETNIEANGNGNVELYFNNSKKSCC